MNLDLYLSEMSVSDATGGGLTVQRILGEDVDNIGLFVHVHPYGHLDTDQRTDPPTARITQRCMDLPAMWLTTPSARRWLGSRPAYWLSRRPELRRMAAKRAAAAIHARLPKTDATLRALVSPQHAASQYVLEELRCLRRIEYVTWVMDDHLVRWRESGWVYPPHTEELFAHHLRDARSVLVISQVMQEFYRQRFGVESAVLFGPTDVPADMPVTSPASDAGLRLAYFGAVDTWQMDALRLVAEQLKAENATLDIYCGLAALPAALNVPGVQLVGRIAPDQVLATMRQYHALVLPISFRPEMRNMSELNIATKMSECLASGVATFAIGPAYAAMIQYLREHDAAICVSDPTIDGMALGFRHLRDEQIRKVVADRARTVAARQLSTGAMQAVWRAARDQLALI